MYPSFSSPIIIHPTFTSDAATGFPAAELPFADVEPSDPLFEEPQAQSDAVITAARINASNFFIVFPPLYLLLKKYTSILDYIFS